MAKISVIIPVYNAEKYISRCLDSIIHQTFKDIEIICVNDNSEDNSAAILEEYSQKDNRVKVVNNTQNLGAASARNKGLDIANGDFIYFIDADDYIDEKYLECMYDKIEQSKCDIILNVSIQSESNNKISEFYHSTMPEITKEGRIMDKITATHDTPLFIWARMYRKSFLNKHHLRFFDIHADDVVFNTITNMYCENLFVFHGEKYHYTVNDEGMTGQAESVNSKDLNHIKAHSFIYDYLKEHNKLDDKLKLFRVYPFMKVDTEEKFNYYKKFFEKIEPDFRKNENIYNEMEKYFAYSLLNSRNYEEYLKNYNKIVTIGFIRRGKN